jgi:hypothetical protein
MKWSVAWPIGGDSLFEVRYAPRMTLIISLLSAAAAYVTSTLLFGLLYYAFTLGAFPYSNCLICTLAWWVLIPLAFWFFPALALLIYLAVAWTSPGDDRAYFNSLRMAIVGFIVGAAIAGTSILASHGARFALPPSLAKDGGFFLATAASGAIGWWLSAHINNGLINLCRYTRAMLQRRSVATR